MEWSVCRVKQQIQDRTPEVIIRREISRLTSGNNWINPSCIPNNMYTTTRYPKLQSRSACTTINLLLPRNPSLAISVIPIIRTPRIQRSNDCINHNPSYLNINRLPDTRSQIEYIIFMFLNTPNMKNQPSLFVEHILSGPAALDLEWSGSECTIGH